MWTNDDMPKNFNDYKKQGFVMDSRENPMTKEEVEEINKKIEALEEQKLQYETDILRIQAEILKTQHEIVNLKHDVSIGILSSPDTRFTAMIGAIRKGDMCLALHLFNNTAQIEDIIAPPEE